MKTLHSDLKAVRSSAYKLFNFFLITGMMSMYSKKGCRKIGPQSVDVKVKVPSLTTTREFR